MKCQNVYIYLQSTYLGVFFPSFSAFVNVLNKYKI
jgi:hypothetical protein